MLDADFGIVDACVVYMFGIDLFCLLLYVLGMCVCVWFAWCVCVLWVLN